MRYINQLFIYLLTYLLITSLQGKGEQCYSQVSHHRPCHGREPCHRLGQGKSGRQ